MAKKSNKTEHVLKLITKNDDAARDDDFFVIDQIEPPTEQQAPEPQPAKEPEAVPLVKEPEAVPLVKEPQAVPLVKEPEAVPPMNEPEEVPPVKEPEVETQQEPPTLKAFREQETAGSVILEQNDDLVNIAEILAREKLALVMERMKVCKCKTCVNDVLALALNSLPTKYVTTDAGKQYFQLDVYKKQYETDILAALTKACVRVKASPRH